MAGINKVILVGHLGKDPEFKTIPSGQGFAKFSLATTERYKDREGKTVEKTEWHNIITWGNLAEICRQYLQKGKLVYIEGKIQTRSWDDPQTGQKRYITEITASDMKMLGPKGSSDAAAAAPSEHTPSSGHTDPPPQSSVGKEIGEDDLPF